MSRFKCRGGYKFPHCTPANWSKASLTTLADEFKAEKRKQNNQKVKEKATIHLSLYDKRALATKGKNETGACKSWIRSRLCPLEGGVTRTSLKIIFRAFSKINSKLSQLIPVSRKRLSSVWLLCVFIEGSLFVKYVHKYPRSYWRRLWYFLVEHRRWKRKIAGIKYKWNNLRLWNVTSRQSVLGAMKSDVLIRF